MRRFLKRIAYFLPVILIAGTGLYFWKPRLIQTTYAAVLETAGNPKIYIPEPCQEYQSHAWKLNDSVHQYLEASYLSGIGTVLRFAREIQPQIDAGKLVPIRENSFFTIDTLWYSYPFLTPRSASLLDEIGRGFQYRLRNTDLKGTRFVVTSVLRTESSIRRLRRRNRNSIRHSAHLHGTTFDITYSEFVHTRPLTAGEKEYLREALAQTLLDLREKKRCWATYEVWQTCFHVVGRS